MKIEKKIKIVCAIAYVFIVVEYILRNYISTSAVAKIVSILMDIIPLFVILYQINDLKNRNVKGRDEVVKILKEMLMFIPFYILSIVLIYVYYIFVGYQGPSANQQAVEEAYSGFPILLVIVSVFIAPVVEESIYRFLPRRFIKNKIIYVIISSLVFALLHCLGSKNIILMLFEYLLLSLYISFRYVKTDSIFVAIVLHSLSNLIACISLLV